MTLAVIVLAVLLALALLIIFALVMTALRLRADLSRERERLPKERKQTVAKSRAGLLARAAERIAPLLPGFPYDPVDAQWVGGTVDCVIWNGLHSGTDDVEVVFLEIKTGRSALEPPQRRIRDAVKAGRVRFEVFRPDLNREFTTEELTAEVISPEEALGLPGGGEAVEGPSPA